MSDFINQICILGAGKVAKSLAIQFKKANLAIEIYSRTVTVELENWASKNKIGLKTVFKTINLKADLYLICVSDSAIAIIAENLQKLNYNNQAIIAHTAGGQNTLMLSKFSQNYGIFYPLQSFSEGRELDFSQIPFCINGANQLIINKLVNLAGKIAKADNVKVIDDQQRSKLHLAAVFVNNFNNFLLSCAQQYCESEQVDFNLLLPLMLETSLKIKDNPLNISELQTGAARRGDYNTINKHLELLENHPSWLKIYQLLTAEIINFYQKK